MRTPTPEHIAHSIKDTHPQLAIDVLRACGYTKRAARRAILREGGEAASTCKRKTPMRKVLTGLLMLASLIGLSTSAAATDVVNTGDTYIPNYNVVCITNATAGYTNSTATPSDITGATCALPANNGDFAKSFIRACFNADATKSTGTTGAIGVYVNGALVTASKRFISSAAGQGTIYGCYTVARADANAQTVKLQGVSADTSLFTVANAVFEVDIVRTLK